MTPAASWELGRQIAEAALDPLHPPFQFEGDVYELARELSRVADAAWQSCVQLGGGVMRPIVSRWDFATAARRSTIFLDGLERRSTIVADILGSAYAHGWKCRANLYLSAGGTPPGADTHRDGADLVVFQLLGRKRWLIGDTVPYYWTAQVGQHEEQLADSPAGRREVTVSPGQLMYLPRGTAHSAQAEESGPSMHLALMSTRSTVADAASWILQDVIAKVPAFHLELPNGTDTDLAEMVAGAFASVSARILEPGLVTFVKMSEMMSSGVAPSFDFGAPPGDHLTRGSVWPLILADAIFVGGCVIPIGFDVHSVVVDLWSGQTHCVSLSSIELSRSGTRQLAELVGVGVLRYTKDNGDERN